MAWKSGARAYKAYLKRQRSVDTRGILNNEITEKILIAGHGPFVRSRAHRQWTDSGQTVYVSYLPLNSAAHCGYSRRG